MIRGLKFRGLDFLASELGRVAVGCFESELSQVDQVVGVPMYWFRRLKRGYDQAELIAQAVAAAAKLPFARCLRRRRYRRAQSASPRSVRLEYPAGSFRLAAPSEVAGQSILLVDDVVTTGATLEAAARALRDAGATKVLGLVLARTPRHGPGEPDPGERLATHGWHVV